MTRSCDKMSHSTLYPDIDECATNQFECPETSHCSDTDGSYECNCDANYEVVNGDCEREFVFVRERDWQIDRQTDRDTDRDKQTDRQRKTDRQMERQTVRERQVYRDWERDREIETNTISVLQFSLFYFIAICTSPCLNGGTCTNPDECSCLPGFTGDNCESDINECDTDSLHDCHHYNIAECVNTHGGYFCRCADGFHRNASNGKCDSKWFYMCDHYIHVHNIITMYNITMDGWIHVDGWMDRWIDGWMDGWMNK